MRIINHIIALLLITAVIPAGLPLHLQEDVNLDGRVALNDAVLLVKNLSTTTESRHGFSSDFSNMVSALQTVAGIKATPSSHEEGQPGPLNKTTLQADLTGLLVAAFELPPPIIQAVSYTDHHDSYCSLLLTPPSPPPKITC